MTRFDGSKCATCFGLWLVVSSIYALTSPGRLDMIDAQYKFETTLSLLEHADIRLRDPHLLALSGRAPADPAPTYAPYPLGAPLAGALPTALARWIDPDGRDLQQFCWSLTSVWFGAAIPVVLLVAWRRLGLSAASSLACALAVAFGTLLWPLAASSFDQAQHALFLLLAVLLSAAAVERTAAARPALGAAVLAGMAAGVVVHYQPAYGILIAPLVLSTLPARARWRDPAGWKVPVGVSLGFIPLAAALLAYNAYRFGSMWRLGPPDPGVPLLDNPLYGLAVLIASPGKGILFFSPLVILCVAGLADLWRHRRRLAVTILAVSAVHLLFVASLSFAPGDWCWGPRYLVATLPLLCLALPFGWARVKRPLLFALLAASVAVQGLALTLDHQRFFFERGLEPHFWLRNQRFYFTHSQLWARLGELRARDVPPTFPYFSSAPVPLLTYAPFGPGPRWLPQGYDWTRQFAVYFWPRPWPLWMARLVPRDQLFPPWVGVVGLATAGAAGVALLWAARRGATDDR